MVVLTLSLLGNAVAVAMWYQQILRNRTTDAELARAIALTREKLAVAEQSAALYITPLGQLARVVGRMEASGYGHPACRSQMGEAARSAQEVVEKGTSARGWVEFYITQAEPYCTGR